MNMKTVIEKLLEDKRLTKDDIIDYVCDVNNWEHVFEKVGVSYWKWIGDYAPPFQIKNYIR